ncbi:hypothetical protein G4177_25550 [Corallococcus sp. ZKHCc1 1396]|uniref:DUF2269 family protein n=1 Tax=Corallococcus soli TaxID=2710757 RepID=A0ABR9PUF0_9BACT|nr:MULTISPECIES: hypothetical protein [Corallococcus]MBE4751543.1 hypothetical protein [Corallococcus soli]MCY1030742.1 hypothetical protein [Corallococcus sp. BB11-1]
MTYYLLKGLHLLAMGVWLGASIMSPLEILRTLARGRPYVELIPDQVAGADKVLIPSAVLTLLTGLGLMRMTQGFIEAPWRFWAGFGLTVVLLLIAKLGLEPTKKQLVVAVQGSGEAAALGSLRGRFIALVTAWHLGFLVILTLMVYPF